MHIKVPNLWAYHMGSDSNLPPLLPEVLVMAGFEQCRSMWYKGLHRLPAVKPGCPARIVIVQITVIDSLYLGYSFKGHFSTCKATGGWYELIKDSLIV
jgi:hypothetical protein